MCHKAKKLYPLKVPVDSWAPSSPSCPGSVWGGGCCQACLASFPLSETGQAVQLSLNLLWVLSRVSCSHCRPLTYPRLSESWPLPNVPAPPLCQISLSGWGLTFWRGLEYVVCILSCSPTASNSLGSSVPGNPGAAVCSVNNYLGDTCWGQAPVRLE